MTAALSSAELRRYGRHLVLPEIGRAGQERLRSARVLIVGLGGLGSPASLYLAAAGVGTLGLVEFDQVDETNLQRQVLYGDPDLGRSKLAAALERLHAVNPHVRLEPHDGRLDVRNARALVAGYDLVLDGSDNFPTRYLVNDACVLEGRPDVWGAVFRFEGQASVFAAPGGPCYRCLFPEPPPPGAVPSCAEAGVFGALPGIVGSIQATEAIKWIAGAGEPLVGRLLVFDALAMSFREVRIPKSPDCPLCSERATQRGLVAYDDACATASGEEVDFDLEPREAARRLAAGEALELVDVRLEPERAIATLPGARWIPLHELEARLEELPRDRALAVYCHTGGRSAVAVDFLRRRGFARAANLAGGIDAWSRQVDPSVPRY
ncbi:MAG: molybdopterin-synthase adenylyltransferase MoeB [Thermoanaerobaculia bacterium]|nr:MAG: molybdopterin-synthase adenylyltransferase MoeB [Thermoanaerobaculia bacterium]